MRTTLYLPPFQGVVPYCMHRWCFCAGVQPSSSGGRFPTPPGLPLSDLPRVTGAYGVTAYDPDFGLGCRGEVEPKASIPPPPPPPPRDPLNLNQQ